MRKAWGDCGGPLGKELLAKHPVQTYPDGRWEGAREVDGVVEVSGAYVLRPSKGIATEVFRMCPVAAVDYSGPWVAEVFRAYRAWETGNFGAVFPDATAALMQAVDHVGATIREMRDYESELRAERRRQTGPSAKAGKQS